VSLAAGAPAAEERAVFVAGEGDEALGVGGEFGPGGEAGAFAGAGIEAGREIFGREIDGARLEFRGGDKAAEILVAGAIFNEERDDAAVLHRDLGADERADAALAGVRVEAWRGVDAVAVEQGEGGQFEMRRGGSELLGERGAAEETEGARSVELDVGR